MTLETLLAQGLTPEQATAVLAAYKTSLNGFVPIARLNEKIAEVAALNATIADRDKQIVDLGKSAGTVEELKKKCDELTTANAQALEKYNNEMGALKKTQCIKDVLATAGVQDPVIVEKLLNRDLIVADAQGNYMGIKEQVEQLKTASPYLFKTEPLAPTPTTPTSFFRPTGITPPTGADPVPNTGTAFAKLMAQEKCRSLGIKTNEK